MTGSNATLGHLHSDAGDTVHPPVNDIRDLLAFKIARLAAGQERRGQSWTQRKFGLRLSEWRVLGIVTALQPVTFNAIGRAMEMDKGQLSRIINHDRMRKYISSRPCAGDNRTIELLTTPEGLDLHARMLDYAAHRNNVIAAHFSREEVSELFRLVDKLSEYLDANAEPAD